MFRSKSFFLCSVFGVMVLLTIGLCAQESSASGKSSAKAASDETSAGQKDRVPEAYHLDFALNELEDGKVLNSRQYSMNMTNNDANEIKIGTRVPVQAKESEYEYLDIGTHISARIGETRGQAELFVHCEVSNFATPDHDPHDMRPVVRQMKIGGSTLLPVSKPIVIGSADDLNSKRQFQLVVTVTKIK
jgi:hypothetical protein